MDVSAGAGLRRLASGQFGLFTAAQARERAVPGYVLARECRRGVLRRVRHGVYAFSDDWFWYEEIAAQWLALSPTADVEARRADPDSIVSHHSAAAIRDLGTLPTGGICLTAPHRLNLRDPLVHTWRAGFTRGEWSLVDGLPVATPARILRDLAREPGDGGRFGTVIEDCLRRGLLTRAEVAELLAPTAVRWGATAGDGAGVVDLLCAASREPVGV